MYQQQRTTRRTYLRTLFLPILTLLFLAQVGVTNLYGQQTTDVAVVEVTLPPAEVPVGTPVTISYTIANNGPADALDFVCVAQITSPSAPNDPLFQEQFLVEVLPVGQTMTIQTEGNWEAGPAGDYNVQIGAAYEFDNAPTNNFLIQDLVVTDGNNLLTLAEAVAILKEEVISSHPRADSLSAVYLSPPANASDSLIPPGVMIEDADSTLFLQYEHPVYFFFLDLYPGELFAHPVEYVAVNAIDGTIDRNTNVEIWPEIDGVTPDFGSDCFGDPNDRRVHGNGVACSEKADRYTPVATGNDGAWAVAVTGKLNKKVEKTTVDHDICKWKERINARGPEVTGANISSSTGKDGCGMTEKELCDAIEALKGKECDKVYFKYIGHGVRSGIFVWDNEHKRSKKITWRNLAKKLKAAGVGEVCIEITACHSGAIIDALKKEGLKGSVITSSSSSRTTPVGDGDGTHWEKALEACSKDEMADLDRNGDIDQCELFAWVKVRGGSKANGPNPQIFKLNDSVRFRSVRLEKVGSESSISTNAGSIKVRTERICLKRRINGRDSTVYRGAVYLINRGRTTRTASRSYELVGRCNGRDTVLKTVHRPSVQPGEKICIADLPNGCTRVRARRVRNSIEKDGGDISSSSAAPDDGYEAIIESVTTEPGAFTFLRAPIVTDVNDQMFTATIVGPADWNPTVHPGNFFVPDNDTVDFFVGMNVPANATEGGEVIATIINPTANDTLEQIYNVYLNDTLRDDTLRVWQANWRWYDVLGESFVTNDGIDMRDVHFNVVDTLRFLEPQTFDLQRSTISAGETGTILFERNRNLISTEMREVSFYGLHDGLMIANGVIDIADMVIGESQGRGITILGTPTLRIDTLRQVSILGTGGPALVIDSLRRPGRIENLVIERAGGDHIVLTQNVDLSCVDCSYDDGNTLVEAGSMLRRYARLNIAVVDTSENPIPEISVRVVGADGTEAFNGLTTEEGIVPTLELLLSTNDGGTLTTSGPYYVTVRTDQMTMRDTVDEVRWSELVYVLPSDVTSVAGEDVADGSTVTPHPARPGERVTIQLAGFDGRLVTGLLHDARGGEAARFSERVSQSGTIQLQLPEGLSAGAYIVQVVDGEGRMQSVRVLVR